MTSIELLKVALIKFIAVVMMSAKSAAPCVLIRSAFPKQRLWHQLLIDHSSYILLVKHVPFCHTTEVYIKKTF